MLNVTMKTEELRDPADFIVPLSISRLDGRMMKLPSQVKRHASKEILFLYGHHSTLERWYGIAEVLSGYGNVTMPDLPGFGGMTSFYKIGQKPSLDAFADYLAAFIKWRYKRKKVAIVAMSFGFIVTTRMLQRYPELTKKVDVLVSIVGFTHRDDFTFSPTRYWSYRLGSKILTRRIPAAIFRRTALASPVLRFAYGKTHNAKTKFAAAANKDEYDQIMNVEIGLWHDNDVRTQMYTTNEFLKLDNTKTQIDLPIWHVSTENDHFFDHIVVEQHLRMIYSDFKSAPTTVPNHAPSVIATAEMAAPFVPAKLRQVLAKRSAS